MGSHRAGPWKFERVPTGYLIGARELEGRDYVADVHEERDDTNLEEAAANAALIAAAPDLLEALRGLMSGGTPWAVAYDRAEAALAKAVKP